ncbi:MULTISPECIES: DUF3987 domain-containing protein [Prochlorococcus]|uniref:DUF3987 domain-containing protein n=1 Tax=Prochlorococcus TaxID=1218 RepID=UPI0007B3771E|nr:MULTISPECIES: DUF3987 domain-containing protein [Prochlorococcus]KZR83599.1 hypothetical protein PMIT1327_00369 [Prochlorococcus marinus str. MIT 1327]NMO84628.1 DUF3987 domain-containing protein [Prochlorococcus sp. P1344]
MEDFNALAAQYQTIASAPVRSNNGYKPEIEEDDDGDITPAEYLQLSERLAEGRSIFTLERLLPAQLAYAVDLLQRSLPTDPLSAALPLMCGYSGLLKLNTRVSSSYDFSKPANLFLACILPTGLAKTSIKNTLLDAPATGVKQSLARGHQLNMQQWKEDNKGVPKAEKSPLPVAVFPHVTDYSSAALYRQLNVNETHGLGQLLIRDELSGLFSRMQAETKGGSGDGDAQLLELFDGDGYTGLRVAEGARTFDKCHVSLYGNVQPEVLKALINGDDPQGKFARFLFCRVPARPLILHDEDPTDEDRGLYNDAKNLLQTFADQIFALSPRTYSFNQVARKRFHAWFGEHQKRALLPGTPKVVAALLGKTSAHALRLAGIMHILKVVAGEVDRNDRISAETVDIAMAIVDQLTQETEAFHDQPSSSSGDQVSPVELMLHIHACSWFSQKSVDCQDCKDKGSRSMRRALKADAFREIADELARLGYGEVENVKQRNGRLSTTYKAVREISV